MSELTPSVQVAVARIREEVTRLHEDLMRNELVVGTAGNVSARVPGADLFVIKPSGLAYDDLSPENQVLCDLDGVPVENTPGWEREPSSDTAAHAYIYRSMPGVGGIAHTHSPYATSFATRGAAVPCVLTAMAQEFGGEIPVAGFAPIGDDSIGREVVRVLSGHRSSAVLLKSHGVFTIGARASDAVRSAVIAEDSARTVHLAMQVGTPDTISQTEIDILFERWHDQQRRDHDLHQRQRETRAG
jgi:L-ribulose-5-phosphate 4-epimerase